MSRYDTRTGPREPIASRSSGIAGGTAPVRTRLGVRHLDMAAWDDVCVRAMVLHAAREPLRLEEVPVPEPGPGQVRLRVSACGVCRTDLHVVDGELPHPKLPLV